MAHARPADTSRDRGRTAPGAGTCSSTRPRPRPKFRTGPRPAPAHSTVATSCDGQDSRWTARSTRPRLSSELPSAFRTDTVNPSLVQLPRDCFYLVRPHFGRPNIPRKSCRARCPVGFYWSILALPPTRSGTIRPPVRSWEPATPQPPSASSPSPRCCLPPGKFA